MKNNVNESTIINEFPQKLKKSGIHPFNLKVSGILGKFPVLEFETRCNTYEDLGILNKKLKELQKNEKIPITQVNLNCNQNKKRNKDLFSCTLRWNSKELFKC